MIFRVTLAMVISASLVVASCERTKTQSQAELASDSSPPSIQASSSSTGQSTKPLESASAIEMASGTPADMKDSPFSCTPSIFGPRDTLTLRMRTPHGDYLTATPPGGTVYFMVYPQLGEPTRRYSLVPSETFKTMSTLRLPATVTATPRIAGRDTIPETFFAQSGNYVLYLGQNMETDYPKSISCRVTFRRDRK
jgi:hypothetical protein